MSSIRQTLAIGALSALAAAQVTPPKLEAPCADVVIFMARGNDAPYHDGRTFPFVEATCGKFTAQGKSCDYIDIQYDVTLGADYCTQVAEGARNGISQITAFNQKCPCTHIVVNGYSEGAHVVGDVLGGPGGCTFVSNGLDNTSPAGKAIGAALLWGNVMHTANQPYNMLDGASLQKNPRSADDLARLGRYAPLLRDYCAAGDPVCAGGSVVADHLNYFELYTDEASSWVVSKIDGTADLCPAASSSVVIPESSTFVTLPSPTDAAPTPTATVTASVTGSDPSDPTPTATVTASVTGSDPSDPTPTATVTASVTGSDPSDPTPTATVTASVTGSDPSASATKEGYPTSAAPSSTVTPAPFPEPIGYEEACHVVYEVQYKYE